MKANEGLGMVFVGGAGVIAILHDWRRGLYFFFAWLLLGDFIRKFLGTLVSLERPRFFARYVI